MNSFAGTGGWIIGGAKGYVGPPSQIIGGAWPPLAPPLPTPMSSGTGTGNWDTGRKLAALKSVLIPIC